MPMLPSLARDHLIDAQSHQDRYIALASLPQPVLEEDDEDNDSTLTQSGGFWLKLCTLLGRGPPEPQVCKPLGTAGSLNSSTHSYPAPFQVFVLDAPENGNNLPTSHNGTDLPLPLKSLEEVRNSKAPAIRIIFYPTDHPDQSNIEGLHELFQDHQVPTVFLSERAVGVNHSFGVQEVDTNTKTGTSCYNSWFHFLCKNIIFGHSQDIAEDRTWVSGGFFMKWHRNNATPPSPSTIQQPETPQITFICFWAYKDLQIRLQRFLSNPQSISAALEDPFVLYVVILDELFTLMDAVIWRVIKVFNRVEAGIFNSAQGRYTHPPPQLDFVTLHKLTKHITYLKESSDAFLITMTSLQSSHEDLMSSYAAGTIPTVFTATKRNLAYTEGLFRSLNLRLSSIEKRSSNIINLAFNLVTQHDSRAFRKNSESMSTIAIMTLIFLPGTAVAAVFGTDFVMVNEVGKLSLSKDFWIFWVFAIPVTLITLLFWYHWRKWHFQRLKATIFPKGYGETSAGGAQKWALGKYSRNW